VAQPTCGRRLSALEAALGMQLFTRAPDGLRLTTEGAALVTAATQMEDAARNLTRKAAATVERLDGVVRIAMTEFTALAFGTRILSLLRERYPAIRIELVLSDTAADILSSEADLAVRWRGEGFRPSPAKVVARKLGKVGWSLFGSDRYLAKRGRPGDPSDLAGHDVVLYPGGPHPGHEWLAKAIRHSAPVLLTANLICNAAAVREGVGLGFFPQAIVKIEPLLRPLTQPVAWGWAWLVMHPDLKRVPRIRAVADVLADALRDDLRAA
jgi:DNA-binding transcriptional LysR family regulator